jgi:hypothetical protein
LGEARQREELEEWERETEAKERQEARDKVVADRAVAAYIARPQARAEGFRTKSRWTWTVSTVSRRLQATS